MWRYNTLVLLAVPLATALAVGCGSPEPEVKTQAPAPATPVQERPAEPAAPPSPSGTMISPGVMFVAPMRVPDDPEEKAQKQAELVARWHEAAKKTVKDNVGNQECTVIAMNLRDFGPEALLPLVDVLADPEETAYIKVMTVECLKGLVHPIMITPLMPLVDAKCDATTRACATHLLGSIGTAEAKPLLEKLVADPERRVRFAALRGLAMSGDPDRRQAFMDLWDDPETTLSEREEIGRVFANDVNHDKENVALLSQVVQDFEVDVSIRRLAVAALGRAGDPAAVPALKVAAEKDPDEYVREIAASAASVIEALERAREAEKKEAGAGPVSEVGEDITL